MRAVLLVCIGLVLGCTRHDAGDAGVARSVGGTPGDTLTSSALDANGRPQQNGLGSTIDLALSANPGISVMIARDAVTTPSTDRALLVAPEGVDQLGIVVDASQLARAHSRQAAAALAGTSLATRSRAQLDQLCPATGFASYPLPSGDTIDLYLPRWTVLRRESLVDLTPGGVGALGGGIDSNGDGIAEGDWHVYVGTVLACDDVETNVVALGKPYSGSWHGTPVTKTLRPYETDLQYLCVQTTEPTANTPSWLCERGVIGEGVFGSAYRSVPDHPERQPGGRSMFVQALQWGAARWDGYFTSYADGLAPIVARAPAAGRVTSGWPYAWNLNPNDHDDTAAGRTEQHRRFLAAVAVKTASHRAGIGIVPYAPGGVLGGLPGKGDRAATAVPATPCDEFVPCTASEVGPARDCGWVPGDVYSCTPGTPVSVGMGADAGDCSRPLGRDGIDTVLRVCAGLGGCAHTDALGEGDHTCATTTPAVAFTCPTGGAFSVMKGSHDGATTNAWDAPGGGVAGDVGVAGAAPAVGPSVTDPCPAAQSGEARDCGWTAGTSYTCAPGETVTVGASFSVDVASSTDFVLRVCDGAAACTWTSPRRLGHTDSHRATSTTVTCGPSGELVALMAPYASGDPFVPPFTSATGVEVWPTDYFLPSAVPSVASTGDLLNGVILHVAVPSSGEAFRSCDWSSRWGVDKIGVTPTGVVPGDTSFDLAAYGLRVAANYVDYDLARCPDDEPPPDAGDAGPDRTIRVTVRAGDRNAYLVPVKGVLRAADGGVEELLQLPAFTTAGTTALCDGTPCCVAAANTVARCEFTTKLGRGLVFEARQGASYSQSVPASVGWSDQPSSNLRFDTVVLADHDWAITADLRVGVCGNYVAEPGEDATSCPADVGHPPGCNHDGVCDPGEDATVCPGDCATQILPDLNAPFLDYANVPAPAPLPASPADVTPPQLTLPANLTMSATSASGAAVAFSATAMDDVDGAATTLCVPASGFDFPVGTTDVHCYASDTAGNTAQGEFTVTILDGRVSAPADLRVEATGPSGAMVTYAPTGLLSYTDAPAGDNACALVPPPRDGAPADVSCQPASGSTLPLGATPVTCTLAVDLSGTRTTFQVAVVDTTPPSLALADLHLVAGPSGTALLIFPATAVDLVDGAVPATCVPAPGSTLSLGTTTVSCTATDRHGNSASGSFRVDVAPPPDTQPPVITTPAGLTATATSASGAVVTYAASATDAVDGPVPVSCTPASSTTFHLGTTTVSCTASDHAGNSATTTFTVRVTYPFGGVQQPINADGTSIFKLGSTIPIKFSLGGIANASAHLYVAKLTNAILGSEVEATSTGSGDSGNLFRYDATSGSYIFNWSTKGLSTGTWQIRFDLGDGTTNTVMLSLR